MTNRPLLDRVAVVAGATRGAGRGIARMLGAAGATVYCTGRSVRGQPATPGRPETIEETAEMVTAEGGRGIAAPTDHTVESEVEQLIERDTPPDEMDRFVVRSRLYQAEVDPSAAEESARLRAWLDRQQ